MVELRVLDQSARTPNDGRANVPEPMVVQLASGFEKIGLAMKSRTWRREGRPGLGPLQRQILTLPG